MYTIFPVSMIVCDQSQTINKRYDVYVPNPSLSCEFTLYPRISHDGSRLLLYFSPNTKLKVS